jgi:hypothetical protein
MDTGSVIVTLPSEENAFGFDEPDARIAPEWDVPKDSDVFFRVVIRYRGPFSGGHETSATWLCVGGSSQLIQRGGAEYNYNH